MSNDPIARGMAVAGPRVLAQSAVAVPLTGTTTKTALATIQIPPRTMRPNSALRVTVLFSATNNANTKTGFVEIGAWAPTPVLTSVGSAQYQLTLRNRATANSQVAYGSVNLTTTAPVSTYAIDFNAAQTLTIYAQLGTASDTVTLEAYTVELLV